MKQAAKERHRRLRNPCNPFEIYTDFQFIKEYRLTNKHARDLCDEDRQFFKTVQKAIELVGGDQGLDDGMFMERPLGQNQNFAHTMYMPYSPANNKHDFGNIQINSPSYVPICLPPGQGAVVSGIDPRYLAAYADPKASFIATGQQMQRERGTIPANKAFGGDYQNRVPSEWNMAKTFTPKERTPETTMILETPISNKKETQVNVQPLPKIPIKKTEVPDVQKSEIPNQIMSRADKLKALHRSGARVFSGPVEKVLKWHKALQDIGIYVLYEIVAKCVNIRQGEPCAKNLVVRDENGPAMQIVYYEVDFLLPELKPPCTVRIIGRMMAGTSRFQAFNVRPATGDDVATLPRRAAVAAHHVAKICKEYSV